MGRFPWTLRLAEPIGDLPAGASSARRPTSRSRPNDARLEIGWTAYAPPVWGTTLNPEAKLLLLGYAFDDLQMGRVQLKTDIRNVRSQQAIARLGARYEGVLRRYQRRADGSVRDTVLFSHHRRGVARRPGPPPRPPVAAQVALHRLLGGASPLHRSACRALRAPDKVSPSTAVRLTG